jgi:hypothetical protein
LRKKGGGNEASRPVLPPNRASSSLCERKQTMQNIVIVATKEDRSNEKSEWIAERPIKLSWEVGETTRSVALTIDDAENLFMGIAKALGIDLDVETEEVEVVQ